MLRWTLIGLIAAVAGAALTWNVLKAQGAEPAPSKNIAAYPAAKQKTLTKEALEADAVARMDLKPLLVDTDQLEIHYPEEWEVIERQHGARLIIQEPMVDADTQPMGVIMYPKNITIARIRGSVPIDFAQKLILEEDLRQGFGTRARVANYVVQTDEGKIMDLANARVIKMPATFTLNGVPMSQLNLLVSGTRNSYLISYVDASANYVKDFPRVWMGLSLLKTTGGAPFRYRYLLMILAGIAVVWMLISLAAWWKSKRVVFDYESDISHLTDEDERYRLAAPRHNRNADFSLDDVNISDDWRLDKA